jgi:tRNA(fMet)-specific endonuclease VapC
VKYLLDTDHITIATTFDELRGQRIRVATMDLRLAAIALSGGLIVLTRNSGDF